MLLSANTMNIFHQ